MAPPAHPAPPISGVFESVLYAPDVPSCARFYQSVLGLQPHKAPSTQAAIFKLPSQAMLLIFNPDWSRQAGRGAPAHGTTGHGHLALRISDESYAAWLAHLAAHHVPIESEVAWPPGGRSIYCRDPAGNSLELAAGDVWGA